ncbi:MAG TPA: type VI secretion system tip protein TssI/VgrG, partial [Pirellulaceae bacterium]|nr:type VI secretion system tip protein TssI/VgrG [Pirellulaceae bacterium]
MAVTTFEVKAPAPGVQFHLLEMSGREELGRPFYYDLTLLADKGDVKAEDVLGKSLTLTVNRLVGATTIPRYYNGLVSRFAYKGTDGDYHYYSLTIRPWLWFLSRATDCRIFQNLKVDKILEKVFTAKSFTDHSFRLNRTYRQWEYCCQYRESDFDFVSRMLEQEGIYYLFEHLDGSHRVKFVDDVASLVLQEGNSGELYFREVEGEVGTSTDFVDEWERAFEVTSGGYVLRDYDFEKPKETLESRSIAAKPHAQGKLERYDYPGEYKLVTEGEGYAKARLEELQWPYKPVRGRSNSSGMGAGLKFKLLDHPASTENQEYFVVANDVHIKSGELEMLSSRTKTRFEMRFQALESKVPYRTPRTTPRPIIAGPQTAVVVGSKGEEIWTDKYGRVKVQFPWDREGKFDENSSCWIRVSQLWAGKNWGGIHVPRVGQEVVVEFLEGDPDRPLITGRVYNAEQPVPYTLPANATQSGIKSRTSKEGTTQNFNELRFEDKKDS